MKAVKKINRPHDLKSISITLGIILVLFLFLFHLIFNLPVTLLSIYNYTNQLNTDWKEQRDKEVELFFNIRQVG